MTLSRERIEQIRAMIGDDTFAGITRTIEFKVPEAKALLDMALSSLASTGGVTVLEWQKNGHHHIDSVWTGELCGLRVFYSIEPEDRVFRLKRGWMLSGHSRDDLGLFPTRAAAEQHANDDWRDKLAGTLSAAPVPEAGVVTEEQVEAALGSKVHHMTLAQWLDETEIGGAGARDLVRAALYAARLPVDVLEEAAKIADQYAWDDHALAQATDIGRAVHHQSVEIAAAIRALKPSPAATEKADG